MHKTFLSLFAVLCGVLMMSCGDDDILGKSNPKLVEFDMQGLSDYTINKKDAIITCYIPKAGGDFVFESVGEGANSVIYTRIEMPGKGDYNVSYSFDFAEDCEGFDFYGAWASISYESLYPYKFRVHVYPNDSGYERSFDISLGSFYSSHSSIHFVQRCE